MTILQRRSENVAWMNSMISQCKTSGDIILQSSQSEGMPRWASEKLYSAYCYIYASMMYDFVIKADSEIITEGVKMQGGEVITGREFLVKYVVGDMITRLSIVHGGEVYSFASKINGHLNAMLNGSSHA